MLNNYAVHLKLIYIMLYVNYILIQILKTHIHLKRKPSVQYKFLISKFGCQSSLTGWYKPAWLSF